ncbi:MAG: DNA-processing protein DprA [Cryobacterium sp.]|nr:DNA-processing protein DprA [Cryobacterium sp.]
MSDTIDAPAAVARAISEDMTRRDPRAHYDRLDEAIEREILDPLHRQGYGYDDFDVDAIADEFIVFDTDDQLYHLDWVTYPELHKQTERFWNLVYRHQKPAPTAESIHTIQQAVTDLDFTPDTVARVAWAVMCEPGSREAGQLIREHGLERSFDMVNLGTLEDARLQLGAREVTAIKVRRVLEATQRHGMTIIGPHDSHWPWRIDALKDVTPFVLWAKGDTALLTADKVTAIVGARAATGYGEHVTMNLAGGLVDQGHVVVSGAAYGIDGMAHRATLAAHGSTVAVMAGGLDRPYPSGHEALYARIVESGLAVSELPPGTAPTKHRFIQRNRIIAAMADVTVVPEAGWRSGSLNTATHAIGLGRPVGAVPGPVTSAASSGTHRLVREHGAALVTNSAEVAALTDLPAVPNQPRHKRMLATAFGDDIANELVASDTWPTLAGVLDRASSEKIDLTEVFDAVKDSSTESAHQRASALQYRLLSGPLAAQYDAVTNIRHQNAESVNSTLRPASTGISAVGTAAPAAAVTM